MVICNLYDTVFAIGAAACYTVLVLPRKPITDRPVPPRRAIAFLLFFIIIFCMGSRSLCAKLILSLTYGWLFICILYPQILQQKIVRAVMATRVLQAAWASPIMRLGAAMGAGISTVYFVYRCVWSQ
jgi:predicted MFS family arabinose efflux permease